MERRTPSPFQAKGPVLHLAPATPPVVVGAGPTGIRTVDELLCREPYCPIVLHGDRRLVGGSISCTIEWHACTVLRFFGAPRRDASGRHARFIVFFTVDGLA